MILQPLSFGITKDGNIITRKIRMLSDVLKLRKTLSQIQAGLVIATEYPFAAAAILSGARKKSRVAAWEHHHFHELKKSAFWNRIFFYTYPRLDAVVCLNPDEKKIYERINASVFVIPNFILNKDNHPSDLSSKKILTVARLSPVKGIDLLPAIAEIVSKKFPDWRWKLIGSGELEEELRDQVKKHGAEDFLDIVKPVDHLIMDEYEQASLFVLLSRNECFPMTLLEAQVAGLPCVAFDCETGPRHIIRNGENGILVPPGDIIAMVSAICYLMEDEKKRREFGESALENAKKYTPAAVYYAWSELLKIG